MREYSVVGKRIPAMDAPPKATGEAQYASDMVLPKMLYGKVLTSPYPHAKILNIDTSKAERLPGVKAVVTWKDTPGKKTSPPMGLQIYLEEALDEYPLAKDKVRYIGDGVAAVAAIDEDTAQEALDLIYVEYEELPAVFDPLEAMKPEAPQIHDHAEGNISGRMELAYGDVEKGFKESDYVREDRFVTQLIAHATMEPHNAVASFNPLSGKLTVWGAFQFLYWLRSSFAYLLDLPWNNVRVIHTNVGGGYGSRLRS